MIGSHRPRPLAHRRRSIWFAVPGNSLAISRGYDFSMVPGLTQRYYRINPCEGNSATLRLNLVNLYGGVGFAARVGPTAARLRLVLSVLDAVENIEEMDQPMGHLDALKDDLFLKEAA